MGSSYRLVSRDFVDDLTVNDGRRSDMLIREVFTDPIRGESDGFGTGFSSVTDCAAHTTRVGAEETQTRKPFTPVKRARTSSS